MKRFAKICVAHLICGGIALVFGYVYVSCWEDALPFHGSVLVVSTVVVAVFGWGYVSPSPFWPWHEGKSVSPQKESRGNGNPIFMATHYGALGAIVFMGFLVLLLLAQTYPMVKAIWALSVVSIMLLFIYACGFVARHSHKGKVWWDSK